MRKTGNKFGNHEIKPYLWTIEKAEAINLIGDFSD